MSYNTDTNLSTEHQSTINDPLNELPLLNVTRGLPVQYVVVLFGYISPIAFLTTLVFNSLIVVVLSKQHMRTPTNIVLLAMAIADLLTLVFSIPWYFWLYSLGNYRQFLHPSILCNLYNYSSEIMPAFFHTASIWCTLLLACQRYVYICHINIAKIWCTNKRVTKAICIIFFAAFAHQLLRFFEAKYEDITVTINRTEATQTTPTQLSACLLVTANWLKGLENVYFVTYFMFRILFVNIGPCLALVIFNVLLYRALRRAEATRNKLLMKNNVSQCGTSSSSPLLKNGQGRSQSISNGNEQSVVMVGDMSRRSICVEGRKPNRGLGSGGRDANSTTFMLIVVVTVFLIVELPLAITTAVHVTENVFELELVSDQILNMTIVFCNFLIIISYPLNFSIYCSMSKAFRTTFQQIFIRRIVENSSNTLNKTATSAVLRSSNKSAMPLVNSGDKSAIKQHDNPNQDLESAASRRTSISSSPLNERINRVAFGGGGNGEGPKVAITDRNGVTQLTDAKLELPQQSGVLCETML